MSKQFKGTPGPWRITAFDSVVCGPFTWSSHVEGSFNKYEDEYNAKLISYTPDLLDALIEMTALVKKNSYPQPDKLLSNYARAERAESLINKALGE